MNLSDSDLVDLLNHIIENLYTNQLSDLEITFSPELEKIHADTFINIRPTGWNTITIRYKDKHNEH